MAGGQWDRARGLPDLGLAGVPPRDFTRPESGYSPDRAATHSWARQPLVPGGDRAGGAVPIGGGESDHSRRAVAPVSLTRSDTGAAVGRTDDAGHGPAL